MSTNPTQFIEMDFDEWCAIYKPIPNNIVEDSSFDGTMFETYGKEVEFVKKADEAHIWMYGDGDDGGTYIWNGWHIVNRIGYFITEVPCPPDTDIQVKVSAYWFYCEGCSAEFEDEGQEINDKFYEYECCPDCATPEQLKQMEEDNA
jgi:hypothetical protein